MKIATPFTFTILLTLLWVALAPRGAAEEAGPQKWSNPEGEIIEAEFVEMTDEHVLLKLKSQPEPVKVAHEKLSAESLEQARRLVEEKKQNERESTEATKGKFKLGEHWIPRGKKTEVMVDIPTEEAVKFLSDVYGKRTTQVKVNVIVPEQFDPADKNALVVICHAPYGNGEGVSVSYVPTFSKVALEENALTLAVDGEFGNPGKRESPSFRSFLVYSALQNLKKDHPADEWRYIHAGHSGGCGYATYTAMYMTTTGYRVAGCYLGVGNYSPLKWDKDYKLKLSQKKQLRLYYSFGKNDKVCPPPLQDKMLDELKRSPYSNVRVSYHMKGHGMEQEHWKEAFQWFKEPLEP